MLPPAMFTQLITPIRTIIAVRNTAKESGVGLVVRFVVPVAICTAAEGPAFALAAVFTFVFAR